MGIRQRLQILVALGKIRQCGNGVKQLRANVQKRVPLENQIGIVSDIAAGCAEVDNRLCGRADLTVSVDVRHHIMPHLPLARVRNGKVNVVDVCTHFRDLLVGNVQSHLLLAFGKRDPELSPSGEFPRVGEDLLHLAACVTSAQRVFVLFSHGFLLTVNGKVVQRLSSFIL